MSKTELLTKEELTRLRAAIDIEIKHQCINLKGRECPFSVFMKRETKKIYTKTDKNPKWEMLIKAFEYYPYETFSERKKNNNTICRIVEKRVKT